MMTLGLMFERGWFAGAVGGGPDGDKRRPWRMPHEPSFLVDPAVPSNIASHAAVGAPGVSLLSNTLSPPSCFCVLPPPPRDSAPSCIFRRATPCTRMHLALLFCSRSLSKFDLGD